MNALLVQPDIVWENRDANFARVDALIADAAPAPGTLIVLPEMFSVGFSMSPDAAEPPDGPSVAYLAGLARRRDCPVVGGVAVRGGDALVRNRALVFGPDGESLADYAKQRPFRAGGETSTPGEAPVCFEWGGARITPFVCYDLRFPELFRRAASEFRPDLYLVLASWPVMRIAHWDRLLAARAVENQAFVIGVNRTGDDPFHRHVGHSRALDWNGDVRADAGEGEATVGVRLDLAGLADYRKRLPFLEDLL